jgi:AcrR family transcriptional regulator
MARITKNPELRRSEILDTAEFLYNTKGFENTSLNDIAEKVGIVKGTLYYYFKTKEDILNAIAERFCNSIITMCYEIVDDDKMDPLTKIRTVLYKEFNYDRNISSTLEHLHQWDNIKVHQRIFILMVERHSPVFAKIIEQGITKGIFKTDYPLETAQFIMAGYRMLFDQAHFSWSNTELKRMLKATQIIIENSLCAKEGSFEFLCDGSLNQ